MYQGIKAFAEDLVTHAVSHSQESQNHSFVIFIVEVHNVTWAWKKYFGSGLYAPWGGAYCYALILEVIVVTHWVSWLDWCDHVDVDVDPGGRTSFWNFGFIWEDGELNVMTVRMSNVSAVVSSLMAARPSRPRSNILNYGTTHNIYAMPRRTALIWSSQHTPGMVQHMCPCSVLYPNIYNRPRHGLHSACASGVFSTLMDLQRRKA